MKNPHNFISYRDLLYRNIGITCSKPEPRLAVIPAIVSFTIATKVTIGKDLTSPALPYLFGLIAIFIVGSGLYSVDYWLLYALAGN